MEGKECLIGMSGGVDSSVAAALLLRSGYRVTGITFRLFPGESKYAEIDESNISAAAQICSKLRIPHITADIHTTFKERVVKSFIDGYREGKTPNPCIICNEHIKFGIIMKKIKSLDIPLFATGHYAGIKDGWIVKGRDTEKDQSYFLYRIYNSSLEQIIFPLADYKKNEIKEIASKEGFDIKRNESQDICFIPDNDYKSFLKQYIPFRPGDIVDKEGKTLGQHNGICGYTIGQRKGLGALGSPAYVIRIEPEKNRIVAGTEEDLFSDTFSITDCVFRDASLLKEIDPGEITIKTRYTSENTPLKSISSDDGAAFSIQTGSPIRGVTPGQSSVLYHNDLILGGGVIK
ncbi:MAG: tRNA 2-thiouridine(34) synthase MnmA [Chitinivibrionales bacterium]